MLYVPSAPVFQAYRTQNRFKILICLGFPILTSCVHKLVDIGGLWVWVSHRTAADVSACLPLWHLLRRGTEGHFQLKSIQLQSAHTNRLWGHNVWVPVMSVQARGDFCTGTVISGTALIPECVAFVFLRQTEGERYCGTHSWGIIAPFKAGLGGESTRLTVEAWVSNKTHNHTDTVVSMCVVT